MIEPLMGCRARPRWREHCFIRSLMVLHWLRWVIKPEKGVELLFVGDDWAEAHVRHEASEVERG